MLHSLKESVSEKLSSVLEKLTPSFQQERRAEVASKRDLKRSKERYLHTHMAWLQQQERIPKILSCPIQTKKYVRRKSHKADPLWKL